MYLPANDAVGKLILRLTVGLLLLPHGIAKLIRGVDGIAGGLADVGVPGIFAYGVYLGEVVAPLLVIAGFYARAGAALIVINMIVAIWLAHAADVFLLSGSGGLELELQYFYLLVAVALIFLGPGRHAINDK